MLPHSQQGPDEENDHQQRETSRKHREHLAVVREHSRRLRLVEEEEGQHQPEPAKDRAVPEKAGAVVVVGGKLEAEASVGNGPDGVEEVVETVGRSDPDHRSALCRQTLGWKEHDPVAESAEWNSEWNPWLSPTPAGPGVIGDPPHQRVGDGVEGPGNRHRDRQQAGRHQHRIRVEDLQLDDHRGGHRCRGEAGNGVGELDP